MKTRAIAGLGVAALAAASLLTLSPSAAHAGTFTEVDRQPITFPNAGPIDAEPFPAEIDVFGASAVVTDVKVRLGDVSHTFPADLDVELVGPDGTAVPLMSDQCAGDDMTNATLFFDDAAASALPATPADGCGSGIFRPGNVDTGEPESWLVPPTGSTLAAYDGTNPDGIWSLVVRDDKSNDTGRIAGGWALLITTAADGTLAVPGPGTDGGGTATTYPVELPVTGRSGAITDVDLTLPGMFHTFPGDLDVLLVSPTGTAALVMSDACGGTDLKDVTLVLDDEARVPLGDREDCGSGRFRPASFGPDGETLPQPAPAPPYADRLSAFDGSDANGTWLLYVNDTTDADGGFIAGTPQLTFTTSDVVAPDTRISRRPHSSSARTARIAFTATETGSRFECRVDGRSFSPCGSPLRLTRLRPGRHRLEVRAVDAAGNVDATPAVARWRVRRTGS